MLAWLSGYLYGVSAHVSIHRWKIRVITAANLDASVAPAPEGMTSLCVSPCSTPEREHRLRPVRRRQQRRRGQRHGVLSAEAVAEGGVEPQDNGVDCRRLAFAIWCSGGQQPELAGEVSVGGRARGEVQRMDLGGIGQDLQGDGIIITRCCWPCAAALDGGEPMQGVPKRPVAAIEPAVSGFQSASHASKGSPCLHASWKEQQHYGIATRYRPERQEPPRQQRDAGSPPGWRTQWTPC